MELELTFVAVVVFQEFLFPAGGEPGSRAPSLEPWCFTVESTTRREANSSG